MSTLAIYCDGCCEPRNPGGYACWAWVAIYQDRIIAHDSGCLGHGDGMTNNLAEYEAVIHALEWCARHKERMQATAFQIELRTDSQLVVKQITGEWGCHADGLRPLRQHACQLIAHISAAVPFDIAWIPRVQNMEADVLSRKAYAAARREQRATLAREQTL